MEYILFSGLWVSTHAELPVAEPADYDNAAIQPRLVEDY
jgi:hypothetical protein